MNNRYSQLTARSAIVTGILLIFLSGIAHAQPEPGYTARDLNPDGMQSGRTSGVVIDPRDPRLAYTVSQGGFFGSTDGGARWFGNFNSDGTPGPFGNGLDNGLTLFNTVAVDPLNFGNVLVLVDDDNRTDSKRMDGIWRSTDGGRAFHAVAKHPCSEPIRFLVGHIRFSTDRRDLVVSSSRCGLGISVDAGANWRFLNLGGGAGSHLIDGLDLFPAGGNFFGFSSSSDIVGFCYANEDKTSRQVGFYDVATGASRFYPVPDVIQAKGDCSFAFDPRIAFHFFVASTDANAKAHIFDGLSINNMPSWHDLDAPTDTNGRPAVVQVRQNGPGVGGIRIYYHNTTTFYYEDCGFSLVLTCPTGPWNKLNTQFSDSTEIAFASNATSQTNSCPVLLSGDGGNERSTDCGASWSYVSGIHTLLVDDAAFTGIGDSRRMVLANFDTGFAIHDGTGAWSFTGADGWATDAIRTVPDEFFVSGQNDDPQASVIDLPYHGKPRFKVLPPRNGLFEPQLFCLGTGLGAHFAPRYYSEHRLVVATLSSLPDALQLWSLDTTAVSPEWRALSAPLRPQAGSFSSAGTIGDLAVGGRLNGGGFSKRFYVIAPSSAGNKLYCIGENGTIDYATGLTYPLRVWASEADASWAYVYNFDTDPTKRGVYVTFPANGRCAFVRDDLASDLLTREGEFKGEDDQEETNPVRGFTAPMTAVGFDPKRRQRAAIGTTHNGILVTQDHGASWSVSHAFPEPNTRPVSIYFDDSGYPETIEETLVAASGRGVWAVRFGAGAAHYTGVVGVRPAGELIAEIRLTDEGGAAVRGAAAYFTVRSLSPAAQVRPIEIQSSTNARGIVNLDQKVTLPPGQYVITARFERGPRFATVWASKVFAVKKNEDDE